MGYTVCLFVGALIGIITMCLVSISRDDDLE
jgi:hypothetical protein